MYNLIGDGHIQCRNIVEFAPLDTLYKAFLSRWWLFVLVNKLLVTIYISVQIHLICQGVKTTFWLVFTLSLSLSRASGSLQCLKVVTNGLLLVKDKFTLN